MACTPSAVPACVPVSLLDHEPWRQVSTLATRVRSEPFREQTDVSFSAGLLRGRDRAGVQAAARAAEAPVHPAVWTQRQQSEEHVSPSTVHTNAPPPSAQEALGLTRRDQHRDLGMHRRETALVPAGHDQLPNPQPGDREPGVPSGALRVRSRQPGATQSLGPLPVVTGRPRAGYACASSHPSLCFRS